MNIDTKNQHGGPALGARFSLYDDLHYGPRMNPTSMESNMSPRRERFWWQGLVAAALALSVCVSPASFAEDNKRKTFDTPEAAAAALVDALGSENLDDLLGLLDHQYKDELLGGDEAAARVGIKQVHAAAKEMYRVRPDVEDRMVMLVGKEIWPVPFPIVEEKGRWRFDTDAGLEEIVNRRIGRNELNAISVVRVYVAAQEQYASADRDDDEVLEYAQRIGSRPGRKDGLYWEVDPDSDEELSPFGPLVADARAYLEGRDPGDPYQGYYFKTLTRQGLNPPGGRYDYVINGNMIAGYAMIAFPADYDNSGIMTFVVNHQGKVYEKDLGEDTDLIAGRIFEYNPDETWTRVED